MTTKFSQFSAGGIIRNSDITVGLRGGTNYQFNMSGINDDDGNAIVTFNRATGAGTAINYIEIYNSFLANSPRIQAAGFNTNVNLVLSGQGTTGFVEIDSVGAMILPIGTTGERPAGSEGEFRYNSTTGKLEYYDGVSLGWVTVGSGTGLVTSISGTANEIDVDSSNPNVPILSLSSIVVFPGSAVITDTNTLSFADSTGAAFASFKAPVATYSASQTYQLPVDYPAVSGYVLSSTNTGVMSWIEGGSGTVLSVTGTLHQIDVDNTDPQNPILSLSSSLVFPGSAALDLANTLSFFDSTSIGYASFGAPAGDYNDSVDYTWPADAPPVNGAILTATTAGVMSWGVIDDAARIITQNAHGFSVGQALYLNGSTYTLAIATAASTAEVVGVVSSIIDANNFVLISPGYITGLAGLTAGTVYFLSDSVAGALTATEPSTVGYISKPILIADSTTSGYVYQERGKIIPTPTTLFAYVDQTGTAPTLSPTTGYICDAGASLITFSLPAAAAVGDYYTIVGASSGGWKIQAGTGQIINIGSNPTSSAGSVSSTNRYDSVTIVCTTANTTWVNVGSPQGTLTVV